MARCVHCIWDMNANDILETEIPARTSELAESLLSASPYTTTALYALAEALRGAGDDAQADRLASFARSFAEHEAKTL